MFYKFKFFLLPQVLQVLVSVFVIVPFSTFYLEPKDFGLLAIIVLITSIINPLSVSAPKWILGGNFFFLDEVGKKKIFFNLLFIDFILKTFVFLMIFILSETITQFFNLQEEKFLVYLKIALFGNWLGLFWPSVSQFLILSEQFKIHSVIETVKFIIGAVFTVFALSYLKMGLISIILTPIVVNLISILFELKIIYSNTIFKIEKKYLKIVLSNTAKSIPTSLADTLKNFSDRYFIQLFSNLSQLGFYSHSQTYFNVFKIGFKSFYNSISADVLQDLTENNPKKILEHFELLKVIYYLLFLSGIILILFCENIISFLTFDKFTQSALYVPIWYIIIFSNFYGVMAFDFLTVKKETNIIALSLIVPSLLSIAITAIFIYLYGLYGGVCAMVLANFSIQIWRKLAAKKLGFNDNIDRYFWIGLVFYICFFISYLVFNYDLIIRLSLFFIILVLIFNLLKSNYKKLGLDKIFNF